MKKSKGALVAVTFVVNFISLVSASHAAPVTSAGPGFTGDPCNFTTTLAYSTEQVLACYRSVPFCPDAQNSATCDRDAQVAHLKAAIEGFSDLKETYDARAHWRRKLDAISRTNYQSDYDFYLDMADVLNSVNNPHWFYRGPACYDSNMFAFLPLEFGSAVMKIRGESQQIVYLRAPVFGFDSLYNEAYGIDVTPYTGQRVVLLNGEPPLQYLRRWARKGLHRDDDDALNLMLILDEQGFTLRTGSFNAFPESRSVTLTLENRAGVRTSLVLPWAILPSAATGFPGVITRNSEEYAALCFEPAQTQAALSKRPGSLLRAPREPMAVDEQLARRRELKAALAQRVSLRKPAAQRPMDFAEVPPEKLNRDITEVLPLTDGARTVTYASETVAIQLRGDFSHPWDDDLAAGGAYACEHAERLILDLRGNHGGSVARLQRFVHYVNAESPVIPNAVFAYRELSDSPTMNELRVASQPLESWGFPACTTGYEPGCVLSMPSGEPITDPQWYLRDFRERRGNDIARLTPLVTHATIVPPAEQTIPCPGKFTGKKLIVLTNGVNGSAAYFAPAKLGAIGTLAVQGGFAHERMTIGSSRGGPRVETYLWQEDADFLTDVTGVPIKLRLPDLPRPVVFSIEFEGFYRDGLQRLHIDQAVRADVHVPFWSNTPETDGAAYRAAVSAVERQAEVDPFCGRLFEAHACGLYERCAKVVLDVAAHRGNISKETASRTLVDAAESCRAQ